MRNRKRHSIGSEPSLGRVDPRGPYYQEFREATQTRERLVRKYSYAVPTEEAIRTLARYSPILEIGAGTGYWAFLLDQAGADVLAFDDFKRREGYFPECEEHFCVQDGGVEEIESYPDRTLFLCWPDPSPGPRVEEGLAEGCLRRFSGDHVAYVGCWPSTGETKPKTGDPGFFERLDTDFELVTKYDLPSWEPPEKEDALRIYRRLKSGQRPGIT